jgi:hypothetical protein
VFLQNCIHFLKAAPGSHSDTHVTYAHDGCQLNDIKNEYITDIQEEQDPLLTTYPLIKSEHEVSCVCVCVCIAMHVTCYACVKLKCIKLSLYLKLLLTGYDSV